MKVKLFDEIYLQFNGADFRTITRKYSKAKIYLIEDGLSSYFKHNLTFLTHKKPVGIYSYNYIEEFVPHECRYNNIKNFIIDKNNIISVCKIFSDQIKINIKENSAIICAQELYTTQAITYTKEMQMYEDCVRALINKGYNVIFKDHPRNRVPFFYKLKEQFPQDKFTQFTEMTLPIEIWLTNPNIKALTSPFSTSLFLCSKLFDKQTYTINYLKYEKKGRPVPNFLFANDIASNLFFEATDNIEQNTNKKHIDNKIKTLLLIKELDLYKFFISRKEFYMLKEMSNKFQINIEDFSKIDISCELGNIIKNGYYFDMIFYNFAIYKTNIQNYVKSLLETKNIKEFCIVCNNGLKTLLKILF